MVLPLDWAPSQYWDGDDGAWSTFPLLIGTPPQLVRVLISTASQTTLAITPVGCVPGKNVAASCNTTRAGIFDDSYSTTWQNEGEFGLALEQNLGFPNDNGTYGLDTVALGFSNTTKQASLNSQVVAGTGTNTYYLGMFGMSHQPLNFSSLEDSHPSYLSTLRSQNLIPSLSWSHTAGARYRSQDAFGSTIFGGYDTSKFVPNNVTFPLASDISRDLVVGIRQIQSVNSTQYTSSLLPKPVSAYIDSTIPYIYLPLESCLQFEQTLGLVYDPTLRLYTVDDGLHQGLLANNTNITFSLGNLADASSTVNIVMPYASFDLTGSFPFFTNGSNTTRYFPLRRAINDTQYTLGRTFLQEAYLITDYERSNFSVSQRIFDDSLQKNLVSILPANVTTAARHTENWRLGLGLGLPIGVMVCLLLASLLTYYIIRRQRHLVRKNQRNSSSSVLFPQQSATEELQAEVPLPEMAHQSEFYGFHEADDTGLVELQAEQSLYCELGDKSRKASIAEVRELRLTSTPQRRTSRTPERSSSEDVYVVSPLDQDSPLEARQRLAQAQAPIHRLGRSGTAGTHSSLAESSPVSSQTVVSSQKGHLSLDKTLPPIPVSAERPHSPRSPCSVYSLTSDSSDGSHEMTRPAQIATRVTLPTWQSLPATPRRVESPGVEMPMRREMIERNHLPAMPTQVVYPVSLGEEQAENESFNWNAVRNSIRNNSG